MRRRVIWASALATVLLLAPTSAPARGQEAPTEVDWRRTAPLSGNVVDGAVVVTADEGGGLFPLVEIDGPAVGGSGYAVVGDVWYRGVEGRGYLEMWNVFPDGGRYFSRTLAAEGPMAALTGTSAWRGFNLPFYLEGAEPPSRLEVNVALPGAGTVRVGPLRVVPLEHLGSGAGWWSDKTAGLVGGIGGALVGAFGATLGWLVARRRARTFVLGAMSALAALGGVLLVAGLAAVTASQPYAVYYSLLLPGALLAAIFGAGVRAARRVFADAELRRMRAMDLA